MATVTTVQITALPTTRSDGSSISASDIGPAVFFKNGTLVNTSAAAAAVGTAFTDTVQAVNGDSWEVAIMDTQSPPVEGNKSSPFVVSGVVIILAPLGAPSISGSVA